MNAGTQVPHGAVRAYVMGERGAKNEPATPEDELVGIGRALAAAGAGVFELAPAGVMGEDLSAPDSGRC